jgi:hypothetical protein
MRAVAEEDSANGRAADGQGLLVIACGALAHEITALRRANGWNHLDVRCLPADLHNRPAQIPAAVRGAIRAARESYRSIFVAYADCGTGGLLDRVIAEEGVERLAGAHCYQFYAGGAAFDRLGASAFAFEDAAQTFGVAVRQWFFGTYAVGRAAPRARRDMHQFRLSRTATESMPDLDRTTASATKLPRSSGSLPVMSRSTPRTAVTFASRTLAFTALARH